MNMQKERPKGSFLGECNRTACNEVGATFYNSSTRKYYCEACAAEINYWSRMDAGIILCKEGSQVQEDIRTELDEVKAIREKAAEINPYLRITAKDKKGREKKVSFKDKWRAEMAGNEN
jgi:hypothetical protein